MHPLSHHQPFLPPPSTHPPTPTPHPRPHSHRDARGNGPTLLSLRPRAPVLHPRLLRHNAHQGENLQGQAHSDRLLHLPCAVLALCLSVGCEVRE